jgi:hypothetical protein
MAMFKVADACDDSNYQQLHKFSKLIGLPDFVKSAAPVTPEAVKSAPNVVFGDPVRRKFPCNTKAATWLAQLHFLEARHLYPTGEAGRVQGRITKAAAYWHITDDVKTAAAKWAEKQSAAPSDLSDADYALVVDYEGETRRHLPISNAVNVKAAAAHLYSKRAEYPYDWRRIAARKILHKAAELEVTDLDDTTSEYLSKAAGFGSTMPKVAAEHIGKRMLMLPESEKDLKEMTAKLAVAVNGMNGIPKPEEMIKLSRIIDRLDREQGFTKYYDSGVDTPEELFFGLTEKKASALRDGHFTLTTGTLVPYAALERIPLAKVAQALGDDFVQRITAGNSLDIDLEKFGQLAATLPRGDASILEKALDAAGALEILPDLAEIARS